MKQQQPILIPIPNYGHDPSEVAIPWKLLKEDGQKVVFATPNGKPGITDRLMITGEKLGIWKRLLMARKDAVEAHHEMTESEEFKNPIKYSEMQSEAFAGMILPGGHDKPVKEYLESTILQNVVVQFFNKMKPVGAICHGLVVAARSIDPKTNKSVIHDYQVTSLLKSQEMTGYNLTRLWLKDYYLTYPGLTVEDEVKSALADPSNFKPGKLPISRDTKTNRSPGHTVVDRNFVSARWPGDVYTFTLDFIGLLKKKV